MAVSAVLVLVAAFVGGWSFGAAGALAGVAPVLAVPIGLAVGLRCVRRPPLALAVVPATVFLGLRPVGAGVQVVQLVAMLAVGTGLVRWSAGREWRSRDSVLLWSVALILWLFVSTMLAERVLPGLRAAVNPVLGVALAIACVRHCATMADLRLLLRGVAIGALAVALPAITQLGTLESRYGGTVVEGRLTGAFVQPNELGSYSVTAFWISCALVAAASGRGDRWLGRTAAVACAATLVFSLSRGSWLGLVSGCAALVVLHPPMRRIVLRVTVLATAAVLVVAVASPFEQTDAVGDRLATIASGDQNPDDRRDLIRAQAVRLMADSPMTGNGPSSYFLKSAEADSLVAQFRPLHAHNVILHVGAELGLVGIFLLLGLSAAVATAAMRTIARRRSSGDVSGASVVALLAAACASLAGHGIIDVTFQNPVIMIMNWFLLGVLLAASRLTQVSSEPHRTPPRPPAGRAVPPAELHVEGRAA